MAAKLVEKDTGLKKFLAAVQGLDGYQTKVGIQGDAASQEHSPGVTNAGLALIHEAGAPEAGIPARHWITGALVAEPKKWAAKIAGAARRALAKRSDPRAELTKIGEEYRTEMIKRVRAGLPPPLKQATIDRKGGETTPLIDTGQMIGAVSVVVSKQ